VVLMMGLSSRSARVLLLATGLVVALTACTSPPPPPTPAPKVEAPPAAAAPTTASAPSPAPSPVATGPATAPSPALPASPVAAASPPAAAPSPVASPAAVSSPAALASPVAVPTAPPAPVVGAASPAGRVTAVYTLPDTPIAAFQNAKLPGSIANDRKLLLGGIGSDLWHQPGDPPDQFWMITDRGPNGQILVDLVQRRTFPIPEFTPTIMKVRAADGRIEIVEALPIVGQSGKPITGLANLEGRDEAPYDFAAETALPYNVDGMDTEALVRLSSGDFWVVDENST